MSDFNVDTASLGHFRSAVDRIQDRVDDLRGRLEGARLAPGAFSRTDGGQIADKAHAEILDGIGTGLDAAVERLRAIAETTAKTIENYESTDARHASAMSEIEGRLNTRGY